VRYYGSGFLFDASGPAVFPNENYGYQTILGFLGSKLASIILQAFNATLHVQSGNIADLPWLGLSITAGSVIRKNVSSLVDKAAKDWDSYETSWDFTSSPLLNPDSRQLTLKATYQNLRSHWRETTLEMQRLEIENNSIFIAAISFARQADQHKLWNCCAQRARRRRRNERAQWRLPPPCTATTKKLRQPSRSPL
jgi:hypothetical protein